MYNALLFPVISRWIAREPVKRGLTHCNGNSGNSNILNSPTRVSKHAISPIGNCSCLILASVVVGEEDIYM